MSDPFVICRLCKGSKFLSNLYEMDGDTTIHTKIVQCIDLPMQPDDGLPRMICKKCKRNIKKFYNFKLKCLQVNTELRTLKDMDKLEDMDRLDMDKKHSKQNVPDKLENPDIWCPIDDLKFSNELDCEESNTSILNEEDVVSNSFQCELCGVICNSKSELRKHSTNHSEVKLLQCKLCSKRFARAESHMFHMRSHLGIRPFVCEYCGQTSIKKQDLVRHMKIHSDEKNHECSICGRRFKRPGDLCSHIRTHTGTRPYKCKICDKDYTSHSGLRKHRNTHYKKNPSVIPLN